MDLLQKSAENYSKYINCNYTFVLECKIDITVAFRSINYYHLAGLQYLTDIAQVDKTRKNNSVINIYKNILKGKITQDVIEKSSYYKKIEDRLKYFCKMDDVIYSKVIVDFDYTKVPKTEILSKYLLYRQYEDGYAMLGLKYDFKNDIYVPETFMFSEHDYYIKDQISYDIKDVICNSLKNKNR